MPRPPAVYPRRIMPPEPLPGCTGVYRYSEVVAFDNTGIITPLLAVGRNDIALDRVSVWCSALDDNPIGTAAGATVKPIVYLAVRGRQGPSNTTLTVVKLQPSLNPNFAFGDPLGLLVQCAGTLVDGFELWGGIVPSAGSGPCKLNLSLLMDRVGGSFEVNWGEYAQPASLPGYL